MTSPTSFVALFFFLSFAIFCGSSEAQNTVLGVYFIEQGRTPTMQQQEAIVTQLLLIQREFLSNFGSTFEIASPPVRTVRGDHDSDWYANTPTQPGNGNAAGIPRWYRLDNMRAELVSKLGLDESTRIVNYPTTVIDGRVGAFVNLPVGQGAYMDFDDLTCVYGGGESAPFPDRTESVCGAHELHELGHIFGLAHEGPFEDCMQQGFYKQSAPSTGFCQFSPQNREIVRSTQGAWLTRTTVQPSPCIYTDACDPALMFAGFPGTTATDSCNATFRIETDCTLTRV